MDGWLKALIAATCIAVIGAIGFVAVERYQRAQREADLKREMDRQETCRDARRDLKPDATFPGASASDVEGYKRVAQFIVRRCEAEGR